jgi:DNA-binding beta-propeller fold protein YncE
MSDRLGSGQFTYETEEGWAKIPEGYEFPDASGVAVDSKDNVYILNRGAHPVIVLDKDGNFVRSWGDGEFDRRAHGIHAGPDDSIYTVNDNQHCIKKYSPEGKLLMVLGTEGKPQEKWGGQPFNTPTNMGVSPNTGDIYVTDGYGNSRVHRFDSEGKHILSWGAPGLDPGEFAIPHNVVIDQDENIYVTDRENLRLQVFDNKGNLKAIWQNIHRPQALCMDKEGYLYIGEHRMGPELIDCPTVGHRVNVYNKAGERLERLGDPLIGDGPTQFIAPHGMGVDSQGNLYVGEVAMTVWGRRFDPPKMFRCFRKLRRVS